MSRCPEPRKPCLFPHQKDAFAELLARARAYFAGEWRAFSIKTRWHSLLVGPTGTGKTAIASLLADGVGAALLRVSVTGWMPAGAHNRAVGETLPGILRHIATHPKTILFLDELDKIYHENSWNSYVRGELFELLDGRWPVGLKIDNDDEDDDEKESLAPKEQQTGEKLLNTTFILAAGTFQQYYEEQGGERKTIGFHSAVAPAPCSAGPTADLIGQRLPRELTNRFNSQLVLLPPLTPRHYRALVKQAEKSLPAWLAPAFREAAAKRLDQAIAAKSGCRFVEEALVDAIKATPVPGVPAPGVDALRD